MSIIKSNMTAPPPRSGSLSSIGEMNSLRFDGTSWLSWTPDTTSNQKTWTWSGWVKRSNIERHMLFSTPNGVYPTGSIEFTTNANLNFYDYLSGYRLRLVTSQVFRDVGAWMHIVVGLDTTAATSTDRAKIYVNGSQVTSFSTPTYPDPNINVGINSTVEKRIGSQANRSGEIYNGYLANIHFIDGQALDANAFGEEISGVWVPKAYSGAYGTNGFHLDFADSGNIGNDVSGRGNHWTVN